MGAYTDYCNEVPNFENFDEALANICSVLAWLLLLPALFEASKILMPGLPQGMESVDNVSEKRNPKSSLMRIGKYFSLLSPDLWLIALGQNWNQKVALETPHESGKNSTQALKEETRKRARRLSASFSNSVAKMKDAEEAAAQTLMNEDVDNMAKEQSMEASPVDVSVELEMVEKSGAIP